MTSVFVSFEGGINPQSQIACKLYISIFFHVSSLTIVWSNQKLVLNYLVVRSHIPPNYVTTILVFHITSYDEFQELCHDILVKVFFFYYSLKSVTVNLLFMKLLNIICCNVLI